MKQKLNGYIKEILMTWTLFTNTGKIMELKKIDAAYKLKKKKKNYKKKKQVVFNFPEETYSPILLKGFTLYRFCILLNTKFG